MSHKTENTSRKVGRLSGFVRARAAFIALVCVAMVAAVMPFDTDSASAGNADGLFPWQLDNGAAAGAAPIGTGFEVTLADLVFILDQIKIAEQHVGPAFNPLDPCANLIGTGPGQINAGGNAAQLPFGLRTLNGVCNNLENGQKAYGATDEPFIRITDPVWRDAEDTGPPGPPSPAPVLPTSYDPAFDNAYDFILDSEPRIISNLIVDQTAGNPAAVAAAGGGLAGPSGSFDIPNVAPDEGLSMPFNQTFIFFGQFFDHGLDLTTKSGEIVFIPLQADDPLFDPTPGAPNFMLMGRAQVPNAPGCMPAPSGACDEPVNQTSPFVDQNQTYTSHPSQQVFQREYDSAFPDPDGAGPLTAGPPVDTGRLLEGTVAGGLGGASGGLVRWADIKEQSRTVLGIELADTNILSVPMVHADLYGNFIPGPLRGMPQLVTVAGLVEGDLAAPVSTATLDLLPGTAVVPAGRAWLADIAHHAVPGAGQVPDADTLAAPGACIPALPGSQVPGYCDDGLSTTYDNEMLDAHFICGDGRCNENIALSSVHHVFHSEHNRLVDQIKATLDASVVVPLDTPEALAFLAEWKPAGEWDGKRLFQAAKFATEMEYQHLAFEEFARKVQPNVNVFGGYDTTIDARIMGEFAHAAYRFGHTMLLEDIQRFDTATGAADPIGLIEAFLNPTAFWEDGLGGFTKTPDEAAGGVLAGTTTQVGQEIDEFVVEALRNNLVGLPLDLATINLARGRDVGIPGLNGVRARIFELSNGSPIFAPYDSWFEFGLGMKNAESLVNFVAAYGLHPTVVVETTNAGRRAAADALVNNLMGAPADASDFMMSTGAWAVAESGLNNVELWVGGLAEKNEIFGGLLGSTLNYIFELQMENLQNGDRFYYLHRLAGLPLLASLEGNSFAELIERNTTAEQLPADVFARPTYTFDLQVVAPVACGGILDDIVADPMLVNPTPWDESVLLIELPAPGCEIRYLGAEHVLFSGRQPGDDNIFSGEGDDTVRGHDGNDRLEGFGGNDQIIGGAGDDIITDTFGDDVLKGGPGNDAIHGGLGFDLLQGGTGNDLIVLGSDLGEILAGPGNDLVLGGDDTDTLFGDGGDDWLEGGGSADLVQGDNGAPFQDNPVGTDGHDILDGGGGNDDYDSEGGDDIMLAGSGTERFEGMIGFDWVTHKGDPQPADSDLTRLGLLPPDIDNIADRFDLVEGLSGWIEDDVLKGDDLVLPELGGGPGNELTVEGIARITDLDLLVPGGGLVPYTGDNIILGGGGSDMIMGRGGDDTIDGDAWLNVALDPDGPGGMPQVDHISDLQAGVFDGTIDPGGITFVREILWATGGTDTAVYRGPRADYEVITLGGVLRVAHVAPSTVLIDGVPTIVDDGVDRLFNIELLQFADMTIPVPTMNEPTGELRVVTDNGAGSGVPGQILIDGIARDTWALDWVDMPAGTYNVCFGPVVGFHPPVCQNATVTAGAITNAVGVYTANAIVRIQTSPPVPSTITVDGAEINDWGAWTEFAPGDLTICFGLVPDMTIVGPSCVIQTVVAGSNPLNNLTGVFNSTPGTPGPTGHGLLRVNTNNGFPMPAGVGSLILVDDVERDTWALDWVKMDPGTYEVCYGEISQFTAPPCEAVTVTAGATTSVEGVYTPHGFLRVTTDPPIESTIFVNSVRSDDWAIWTDFEPGDYEVCYEWVGTYTPPCSIATVTAGGSTHIQNGVLIP